MNIRKTTSMTLLLSLLLLLVTSIILYIVPHGRVAYWSDWHLWGLTKTQWGNLHVNLGFFFLLTGLLHIFFNWKPLVSSLKNRAKRLTMLTPAFTIALVLSVFVSVGTLFNIPPMSLVTDFGEAIKEMAAEKYGEPPYGHAELSSLDLFIRRTGLDPAVVRDNLEKHKIHVQGGEQSIIEIAHQNNLTPKELFALMQSCGQQDDGAMMKPLPTAPPPGFARRTLEDICLDYHLDYRKISGALQKQGLTIKPGKTFKSIARVNKMNGHRLFDLLYKEAME